MEYPFESSFLPCLRQVLMDSQNQEQTQELRIPDGMPDLGRVLAVWGQPVLRGKEWRTGAVGVTGGMMVRVLYAPEDGSVERTLESWVPFQMKLEIPEDVPDGSLLLRLLPRYQDARSVSPRKLMLRCGMALLAEGYVPMQAQLYSPGQLPEDVQLLREKIPVRLPKEAGEKSFLMDEELSLPDIARDSIASYRLEPVVTDQKVMTNRVVFRGSGNLHMVYRGADGLLTSMDMEIPFSQYGELEGEYGADAQAEVTPMVTSLELEQGEDAIRLKAGVVGQYLITQRETPELVRDAYSTTRDLTLQTRELELPAVLEQRRETLTGELTVPGEVSSVADVTVLPELPRLRREGDETAMETGATAQVLYYDNEGMLRSANGRMEVSTRLPASEDTRLTALPGPMTAPQTNAAGDGLRIRSELPVDMAVYPGSGLTMGTGLTLGEEADPDPNRPSMILRRRGSSSLWEIARLNGTTVEAIRRVNGLEEEPPAERMLLIPIP